METSIIVQNNFMFQLNGDEFNLIFQNGTSSWGGTRIYEVLDDLVTQKRELEKPSNPIGFIKPN